MSGVRASPFCLRILAKQPMLERPLRRRTYHRGRSGAVQVVAVRVVADRLGRARPGRAVVPRLSQQRRRHHHRRCHHARQTLLAKLLRRLRTQHLRRARHPVRVLRPLATLHRPRANRRAKRRRSDLHVLVQLSPRHKASEYNSTSSRHARTAAIVQRIERVPPKR